MGLDLEAQLADPKARSQASPHKKAKKEEWENTEAIRSQESPQTATQKSKKKINREEEENNDGTVLIQNEQPLASDEPNEQPPVCVKFEVIYDHSDKTPPIVGYFPSGYKPHNYNGYNNNEENLSPPPHPPTVSFYRSAQRIKIEKSFSEKNDKRSSSERMELVVSPDGSNVNFVGKNYKGEAMAAQLCTYALGVLDKNTQTLKIMPIAGNKIFRLEPKVRGLDTADKEPSCMENEEASEENKADKIMALNVKYGSKRSIVQYKKAQALKQGDDPESQKDLSKKIDNIVVNKEALESASTHIARNIPPHNSSATTPQEAYPLNRIILTGERDFLEDVYEILQVGTEARSNAYPTFVRNRIHKLLEIQVRVP
uniref:Uncharacterized protein n=1 Tax=Manihot esculenta TaxID=3983 RepID=A0A2C9W2I0_MANES